MLLCTKYIFHLLYIFPLICYILIFLNGLKGLNQINYSYSYFLSLTQLKKEPPFCSQLQYYFCKSMLSFIYLKMQNLIVYNMRKIIFSTMTYSVSVTDFTSLLPLLYTFYNLLTFLILGKRKFCVLNVLRHFNQWEIWDHYVDSLTFLTSRCGFVLVGWYIEKGQSKVFIKVCENKHFSKTFIWQKCAQPNLQHSVSRDLTPFTYFRSQTNAHA